MVVRPVLGGCRLTRTMTPTMLSSLTGLDLYTNILSASIPRELGRLSLLTNLNLYANRISGTIPHAAAPLLLLGV